MDFIKFNAGIDDDGRRLDKAMFRLLPEKKSGDIFKAIRKGLIKVGGKKAPCELKLKTGDEIEVAEFLLSSVENEDEKDTKNISLVTENIILKNENFLIINKPYDVLVQGAKKGDVSLDKIVAENFSENSSLSFRPGPLHRLDRKTSGILFFSQSLAGAQFFSDCIKNHKIKKTYIALLEGKLLEKEKWVDYLKKNENPDENFKTVSAFKTEVPLSKIAITVASPIEHGTAVIKNKTIETTLAKIEIETGRTHQIRCQSSFHAHPLLGDTTYNGSPSKIKTDSEIRDFYLHAWKVEFSDDVTEEARKLGLPKEIESRKIPQLYI